MIGRILQRVVVGIVVALVLGWFHHARAAGYPRPPGWEWYGTSVPNGTAAVEYVTGGAKLVGGPGDGAFIGRTFGAPSSAGVSMAESIGATVGGNSVVATGARFVAAAEVANGAAALVFAWKSGFAIGTEIADYLGLGTRLVPQDDGWGFDSGSDPANRTSYCYQMNAGDACATTPAQLCSIGGAAYNQRNGASFGGCINESMDASAHTITLLTQTLQGGGAFWVTTAATTSTGLGCPASIDAVNPAYDVADGSSPGPDGKCRTGRYNHVDQATAAARMNAYGNTDALPEIIPTIISNGVPIAGQDPTTPLSVSPGSVTGQPTQSTTQSPNPSGVGVPDGDTTTTTTTTPTTHYTTNNTNTINYNITNQTTTQTCVGGGSCTTTTTGTTNAPGATNDPSKTPCENDPGTIGCMTAGSLPTDAPLWQAKDVQWATESVSAVAACPDDVSISFHSWALPLHFAPACQAAPIVRIGMLAAAAFGALFLVVLTVSKT